MTVSITQTIVTPNKAKALLSKNFELQRKPREYIIERYASDMASGQWNEDVGGIIVISDTGKVIDGQHRLAAVVKSGVPVKFYVQTGVEENAYKVIDNGVSRKVTDVMTCKNKTTASAIAKMSASIVKGTPIRSFTLGITNVSKSDIIEYYENNSRIIDKAAAYSHRMKSILRKVSAQGLSMALYIMMHDDEDAVDYFVECFMETLPSDERVASYKSQAQTAIINDKWDKYRQLAMTLRCLEAIRDDEPKFGKFVNTNGTIDRWDRRFKNGEVVV